MVNSRLIQASDIPASFASDVEVDQKIAAHVALTDPHSQYTTITELLDAIATAIAEHISATDPHAQYATASAVSAAIAEHLAATDPHSQYATAAELSAAISSAIAALTASSIGAQPSDSDLTAIANLSTTGFVERTGSGTATARSLTADDIPSLPASKIATGTISDSQIPSSIARDTEVTAAIAAITTASIGAQPVDSDLTAIAALTTTPFGRSLLTMATAAATRTALSAVGSDPTGYTGAIAVSQILAISQANYDALPPEAKTDPSIIWSIT